MHGAGLYILGVCAFGGLIAVSAFWWAAARGQFGDSSEARFLVFETEEEIRAARRAEQEAAEP